MNPHLSIKPSHMWNLSVQMRLRRCWTAWMEDKPMARSLSPRCWPPGHSHPPYLPPHSPRRFSPAGKELPQVSCGLEILLPCPQSPTQEPLQLQLLPSMSRATRGLPLWLVSHPTHFCHFSSGQSSGCRSCWFGSPAYKGALQFSARKLPYFWFLKARLVAKPVGISKGFQVVWYIPAYPNGSFHMYSCAHANTHPCLPSILKLVSWQLCRVTTEPLVVLILIVVLQVTLATCALLLLAFNVQSVL